MIDGREVATVVPVTHVKPADPADAVEIPAVLKALRGLDDLPSWIVVTETNEFLWPGPDLRPVSRATADTFDYGMLPPRFFAHLREKLLQSIRNRKLKRVQRSG
jgi:hypothetical protein